MLINTDIENKQGEKIMENTYITNWDAQDMSYLCDFYGCSQDKVNDILEILDVEEYDED